MRGKSKFIFIFFVFVSFVSNAQIFKPVKWSFSKEKINDKEYYLVYTAKIDKGWTIYSQYTSEDGPVPTYIEYEQKGGIDLLGKSTESGSRKEGMDALFGVNVIKFSADKNFVIRQKIKVKDANKPVSGYVTYMACDNEKCLPPTDEEFTFLFSGSEVAQGTDSSPEVQNSDNESTPGIVVLPVQMDTTSIVKSGQMDDIADRGNMLGPKITGNKIDQKIPELYKTQQNPLSNCGGEKETKEGMFGC
ncbi:MAG: hypothetical protein IPG79_06195 [Saprospiraceae bacterium]|nr:hypothetical protein [Saprospiraceae bacterium]